MQLIFYNSPLAGILKDKVAWSQIPKYVKALKREQAIVFWYAVSLLKIAIDQRDKAGNKESRIKGCMVATGLKKG